MYVTLEGRWSNKECLNKQFWKLSKLQKFEELIISILKASVNIN